MVSALLSACTDDPDYAHYQGSTMGTVYRVVARCPVEVGEIIEEELALVNGEMSTYAQDSTLSKFNRAPQNVWYSVSPELLSVIQVAQRLSEMSKGAFDVTVGPLVNAWGFGPAGRGAGLPSTDKLSTAMTRVGFAALHFRVAPPALSKQVDLYVDLSAIAKGHAVDQLARRLRQASCTDYMVEIGGEVVVWGRNPVGNTWRVGIEVPGAHSLGEVHKVLELREMAVATSGDYRNFIDHNGRRYSHTMDPRTGAPTQHSLASVTVVHESAMWADGLATLINVMGPVAGWEFAEQHDLPALFIVRGEHGFDERYTAAMGVLMP